MNEICDHKGHAHIIRMCVEIKCKDCGQIITRRCYEEAIEDNKGINILDGRLG